MKPASVIIMDEHPIVRMSIEVLLGKNSNIQVVLKTDDSRTAIEYLRTYPVDLVILDIELPGTDGFTLLKRIKSIQENTRILFLSSKSEAFYAGRAIRAGANGFVSKRKDLNDIYNAVKMILSGYSFFHLRRLISSAVPVRSKAGTMICHFLTAKLPCYVIWQTECLTKKLPSNFY
ncbi:transcriptional regulator [Salmonella enterica subsp. diarizonae]|uniref:Transcriptional regulator n=1 Tax=Salmonella diarizonae TaxID=59204 RepID=A0A379U4L8_SALDZ|nr:transcriptional regulator [Salmonella enterica subsp. diarizonae]